LPCTDQSVLAQRGGRCRSRPVAWDSEGTHSERIASPKPVASMHQYNEGAPRLKTRAALMATPGADWTVESIDLDGPRAGEVLVRFTHAGLCFSDEHLRHGSLSDLPVVGGHEGAGIVEEVGAGVTRLSAGDHVAASFIPACGRCPWC